MIYPSTKQHYFTWHLWRALCSFVAALLEKKV